RPRVPVRRLGGGAAPPLGHDAMLQRAGRQGAREPRAADGGGCYGGLCAVGSLRAGGAARLKLGLDLGIETSRGCEIVIGLIALAQMLADASPRQIGQRGTRR